MGQTWTTWQTNPSSWWFAHSDEFPESDRAAHARIRVVGGILGPNATQQALAGKHYNRAMRSHKLTWQALWRFLWPQLLNFVEDADEELFHDISCMGSNSTVNQQGQILTGRGNFRRRKREGKCKRFLLVGIHGNGITVAEVHTSPAWWYLGLALALFRAHAATLHEIWP